MSRLFSPIRSSATATAGVSGRKRAPPPPPVKALFTVCTSRCVSRARSTGARHDPALPACFSVTHMLVPDALRRRFGPKRKSDCFKNGDLTTVHEQVCAVFSSRRPRRVGCGRRCGRVVIVSCPLCLAPAPRNTRCRRAVRPIARQHSKEVLGTVEMAAAALLCARCRPSTVRLASIVLVFSFSLCLLGGMLIWQRRGRHDAAQRPNENKLGSHRHCERRWQLGADPRE